MSSKNNEILTDYKEQIELGIDNYLQVLDYLFNHLNSKEDLETIGLELITLLKVKATKRLEEINNESTTIPD